MSHALEYHELARYYLAQCAPDGASDAEEDVKPDVTHVTDERDTYDTPMPDYDTKLENIPDYDQDLPDLKPEVELTESDFPIGKDYITRL